MVPLDTMVGRYPGLVSAHVDLPVATALPGNPVLNAVGHRRCGRLRQVIRLEPADLGDLVGVGGGRLAGHDVRSEHEPQPILLAAEVVDADQVVELDLDTGLLTRLPHG